MSETSVSSISTDWSLKSIPVKSDLPIFIDKSIPVFIESVTQLRMRSVSSKYMLGLSGRSSAVHYKFKFVIYRV